MPPDKVTARGHAAQKRICEAAEPVFAARGFYGANVRELAAAAGTATASLLHHFPTKEKLYAAVLAAIAGELEALFDRALGGEGDHRERLVAAVDAYLTWSAGAPGRSNLLLRELLDNPARLEGEREVHLVLAPLVERLQRFIRAGQRAGDFRAVEPIAFITHLVGGAAYLCAAQPTFERLVPERRRANLARRCRDALGPLITEPLLSPSDFAGRGRAPRPPAKSDNT